MTPLDAATHADPYAYYARLRLGPGLSFDATLGLWVASSARMVDAILAHPECRVRPPHEPVPPAIAEGAAGQVFARLMRMNEGTAHRCPRAVIEPVLAAWAGQDIAPVVARLLAPMETPDEWLFTLPASVIATLLGFAPRQLTEIAGLTRDFVACLSPLSSEDQLRHADGAATRLRQMFRGLLEQTVALADARRACEGGDAPDGLIANLIGLLSQTCEATAGLIGNTLVALQREPGLLAALERQPSLMDAVVAEVARHDSPVQNTRRFVAARCTIGDSVLEPGAAILLLLACANRDPEANPDPERFLLDRVHPRTFGFGAGRHQCPGRTLALSVASQVIQQLLRHQSQWLASPRPFSYWPSLNGRIPRFDARAG